MSNFNVMNNLLALILIMSAILSCSKDKKTEPADPTYFIFKGQIGANDNSTFTTSDNNLLICGNKFIGNLDGEKIYLYKVSKGGNQIWKKEFITGQNPATCFGVVESSTQEYFICGYKYNAGSYNVLLLKTNSNGDQIWIKTYGGNKDDTGREIINTADGNLLISATSYSYTTESKYDIYLIKVNTNGDTLWTKTYLYTGEETPYHLLQTQNGEYLITGTSSEGYSNSQTKIYLLKVDVNGTKLWDKQISGFGSKGLSTLELSNGDLLICGGMQNIGAADRVLVVRTDQVGNQYWEKQLGTYNYTEVGNSMKQNADGTFTLVGIHSGMNSNSSTEQSILLMKIDQNGNEVWTKTFGSKFFYYGMNLIKDINDDNIITGTNGVLGANIEGDIFIAKTDNNGNYK